MKYRCQKGGSVVLPLEATKGWDGDDEDDESDEDWLWGREEDEDLDAWDEGHDAPDGGWGWVVTFASFVIYAMASMFTNCFGVLFAGFLLELGTSTTKVSEIFNLSLALSSFFTFLAGPLVEQFGWRRVTFITSLVYSAGLAASTITTSASFIFMSTMMIAGMCILMLEVIAQHTVSLYFTRRRRLATCMVTLGTCASQVLMTPLITYLQAEFTSRGATLIMAATVLNCCVAAMFLHPVEWHTKQHQSGHAKNIEQVLPSPPPRPKQASSASESLARVFKESMKNLRHLRCPRIAIITVVLACNTSTLVNIWAIVPFALHTDGYSPQEIALCLSVAGICNMASRLSNAVISCCTAFTVQQLYIIGSTMSALGIIGFCWASDLFWKTTLFGLCGLGSGTVSTLYCLVPLEVAGLKLQLPVLSLAGLITGLWFLLVDPLTGLVRDVTGSYSACLVVLGSFLLASLVLWLLMPPPPPPTQPRHHLGIEGRPLVRPFKPLLRPQPPTEGPGR
ncbi:Monocarboxylate transporter 13 [Chionoecetes opilio]|uniref:Monocarboxylate transporter 13 n=1 Tax=Chionoecetes opilio TaxID=41210 RepID=A0A8J5CR20_CHIOP|nr:Monocarboxylate transporter 13 [Chionoecetes opilio]